MFMTSQNIFEKVAELEKRIGTEIGPQGGKIIGETSAGNPIYDTPDHPAHKNFTHNEHLEASNLHDLEANRLQAGHGHENFEVRRKIKQHRDMAGMHHSMAYQQPTSRAAAAIARLEKRLGMETGPNGGHVIGKTRSGKPIYDKADHPSHQTFTPDDHYDAALAHHEVRGKSGPGNDAAKAHHAQQFNEHSKHVPPQWLMG